MNDSQFRIGAVSRLTGIPSDTLRVWERRYEVVQPHRTEGGNRLYSQEDIDRLTLIKRLVDNGHAIGTVANLTLDQLRARAEQASIAVDAGRSGHGGPVRVVLLGPTLPVRLAPQVAESAARDVEVVASFTDADEFSAAAADLDLDVLVAEFATLNDQNVTRLRAWQRRCGADRAVVVYGFSSSLLVERLNQQGIATVRFPVTWADVRRLSVPPGRAGRVSAPADAEPLDEQTIPPREYDDTVLSRLVNASVTIKCECPHHMADLIISLARFEEYSQECRNQTREDAALHAYLYGVTARARHSMERALSKLLEVEGIDAGKLHNG